MPIVFPSCVCLCLLCAGLDNSVRGGGSSYFVSLTCFSEGRMDLPRVVSSKWTRAVQLLLKGGPGREPRGGYSHVLFIRR